MADIEKVKDTLQNIMLRLEALEIKVAAGYGSQIIAPGPLLECVQCGEKYKESQNAEGYCKYHESEPKYYLDPKRYIVKCCNQSARDYDSAKLIPACKKGRHCSEHHNSYPYAAYTTFIKDTVSNAHQVWLEVDVKDFVAVGCKWAEVGLSEDNKVYVACGKNKMNYNSMKLLSMEELKEYTNEGCSLLLKKSSDKGWSINASMIVKKGSVRAIEVSVKAASSSHVTTKRVFLNLTGTIPALESVEDMSTTTQNTGKVDNYTLPKDVAEGRVIDVNKDYSKNIKTDYIAEVHDGCTLKIIQNSRTKVDSDNAVQHGKWRNLFTVVMVFANTGEHDLAVTDMQGYYCNTGDGLGQWIKCDDAWIGTILSDDNLNNCNFYDTPNFSVKATDTETRVIRLGIKISGNTPHAGTFRRADPSLPQPLHLKAVFTDQNKRKASIRFEFGNPPPNILSNETIWSKINASNIYSYCFADNINNFTRSYAAMYFRVDDGILAYHRCLGGSSITSGYNIDYIGSRIKKYAYNAKQVKKAEYEIEELTERYKATEVKAYALVDLDREIAYGFKMMIKTPTASAVTHCLLPQLPDPSTMSLTVSSESVEADNDITVKWQVSRASKTDYISVYHEYGKKEIKEMRTYNNKSLLIGEVKMKAPTTAGVYEARYYYCALSAYNTGNFHDIYWKKAKFIVIQK